MFLAPLPHKEGEDWGGTQKPLKDLSPPSHTTLTLTLISTHTPSPSHHLVGGPLVEWVGGAWRGEEGRGHDGKLWGHHNRSNSNHWEPPCAIGIGLKREKRGTQWCGWGRACYACYGGVLRMPCHVGRVGVLDSPPPHAPHHSPFPPPPTKLLWHH